MKQKKYVLPLVLFLISSVFYLLFYMQDGIILTEDANSYIMMETHREPGYCIFLWLFRWLFGTDIYLQIVVVVQCLIAGAAASVLTVSLKRKFSLKLPVAAGILIIQYAITLLNRFVAQRGYSYYNSIETEAVAYSVWIFFMVAVMHVIYDKRKKDILSALVCAIILMTIRKQMYITLGVLFFAVIYALWKSNKKARTVLIAFLVIFTGLISNKLIDKTYNLATRGVFEEHTGDASFIFGTEIYMADESYADYISNERSRELFLQILMQAKEKGYNRIYADNDFFGLEDHYSLSYDRIKFDIVNVVIRQYADELEIPEEEREKFSSELIEEMVKELFMPAFVAVVELFWQNVLHGLVITVALRRNTLTVTGAIVVYMLYIFMVFYLLKKRKENIADSVIPLVAIMFLAILGNIALTSATIYCQARYMLYNTALFYQLGFILLVECFSHFKENTEK